MRVELFIIQLKVRSCVGGGFKYQYNFLQMLCMRLLDCSLCEQASTWFAIFISTMIAYY